MEAHYAHRTCRCSTRPASSDQRPACAGGPRRRRRRPWRVAARGLSARGLNDVNLRLIRYSERFWAARHHQLGLVLWRMARRWSQPEPPCNRSRSISVERKFTASHGKARLHVAVRSAAYAGRRCYSSVWGRRNTGRFSPFRELAASEPLLVRAGSGRARRALASPTCLSRGHLCVRRVAKACQPQLF